MNNLNPVYLIAAIVALVITLLEWNVIGRWARVIGILLAVVFILMVNFHNL